MTTRNRTMAKCMDILAILAVVLSVSGGLAPTRAQPTVSYENPREAALITADYSLAAPFGATSSFTGSSSVQGVGLDLRYFRSWYFAGASVSWQIFRDERQAPSTPTGAMYEARTMSLVPVLATGHYVWNHGDFRSFVGIGLGTMLARQKVEARAEQSTVNTWFAAYSLDGGGIYKLATGIALEARMRFTAGVRREHKSPQMMQLAFGLTFIY